MKLYWDYLAKGGVMFDVLYVGGEYFVTNDSESYGPFHYAAEAQEKADELNKGAYSAHRGDYD